ncbi:MAG: peptidase, partial [Luteimonas sp.]|nr:peptidase [Luteimonas sp.]
MTVNKPQVLLLSLAVTLALAACKRDAAPAADSAATPAPTEAKALTLDESKLPPMNSFKIGDLDTSKNACADFGGYVNGKWLAANAIP